MLVGNAYGFLDPLYSSGVFACAAFRSHGSRLRLCVRVLRRIQLWPLCQKTPSLEGTPHRSIDRRSVYRRRSWRDCSHRMHFVLSGRRRRRKREQIPFPDTPFISLHNRPTSRLILTEAGGAQNCPEFASSTTHRGPEADAVDRAILSRAIWHLSPMIIFTVQ